ncbi:MAG: glycosyltransferase family 4 protein [Nanoarchaeota archaeon]|nr:glycosyltransferase family 4 protein [Nanoarchaeota archaeon]
MKATYIRDGVKGDNIKVAPIGYDHEIFYPRDKNDKEVKKVRKELRINDDEIMILTAGGDVTSKGAQEILKALNKIKDKIPKWKYVCKIWPSPSARIWWKMERELITIFGFEDKVVYSKKKLSPEKMGLLLNACDIYAAPSRLEGFGMIQLEAQACGKPVVSINTGGPQDTVSHGKTGFLADVNYEVKLNSEWVYPKMGFEKRHKVKFPEPKTFAYRANVNQLADYLLMLMKDNKLREKMGKNAAKHAFNNFNYIVSAKHISNLIKKYVLKQEPTAIIQFAKHLEKISQEEYCVPGLKV